MSLVRKVRRKRHVHTWGSFHVLVELSFGMLTLQLDDVVGEVGEVPGERLFCASPVELSSCSPDKEGLGGVGLRRS